MTRTMVRLTAAVLAAVFLWLLLTLPPRPAVAAGAVAEAIRARTVAGAVHVHSIRSDGSGDREAIAAAAARVGLKFVVITDHGDGTRPPDPPAYLHGVLCLDAVEISTNGGHLIALDMPSSPYPLGGESAAVVEDVLRLGGMPVVAHPDSAKSELAWKDWGAPVAGLEWINLDSGWRDEPRSRLARVAFDSLVRPGPALASLLDRPAATLARWDQIAATRTMVALAGHDAHGGLARRSEEGSHRWIPGFLSSSLASYEASFATFAVRVILDAPLRGDAAGDARRLFDAVRAGHVYTAIDAIAAPAWVDFHASLGSTEHGMGEALLFASGLALTFRSPLPVGGTAVLLRDGVAVAELGTGELLFDAAAPGVYRVEVRMPRWAVPWIVTNPIYLRSSAGPEPDGVAPAPPAGTTALELTGPGLVEKDPQSTAELLSNDGRWSLDFRLRSGERVSQYVAIAVPLPRVLPPFDRVVFTGQSSPPLRVSVQVRFDRAAGARWVHSVFLSSESRQVVVPVDRLVPADQPQQAAQFDSASSLLFVVDLTNASPGSQGRFEISNLRLATTQPAR
jgi:hypothetical protein